jgi:hypothetical protein
VDVDDRAAAVAGEDRGEGAHEQQRPEDVRLERRPDLLLGGGQQRGRPVDPGVVDEHVGVRRGGDCGGDGGGVGHVKPDRHDARVAPVVVPPRAGVDLGRAARERLADELPPEAAGGAGNEDYAVVEVHGYSL